MVSLLAPEELPEISADFLNVMQEGCSAGALHGA